MWMPSATTITPPDGEPIDLEDAKGFLRVEDDTSQDDTISTQISGARQEVEKITSTRLLTQTVRLSASDFSDLRRFPIGPVQSITSISYSDMNGVVQTLDAGLYERFGEELDQGARPAYGQRWPTVRRIDDAVKVTLVVGYGGIADVPKPLVEAMLLLLGDAFTLREDTIAERSVTPTTQPNGVTSKLTNFMIYG